MELANSEMGENRKGVANVFVQRVVRPLLLVVLILGGSVRAFGADEVDTALLRRCLVTLQPVYDGMREQYLVSLRAALSRHGYRTAVDLLEDYMGGGFLSGVGVEYEGNKYVLTSRHGLSLAKGAIVELEDGEERIGRCEIAYADGPADLAVVLLPEGYNGPGMQLDTSFIGADTDLAAAGYQGLGEQPYWVLETEHRRIRATPRDVRAAQGAGYIEYDASFGPGMTGGALLAMRQEGAERRFSLVGINIWKATLSGNRALAVPARVALEILGRVAGRPGQEPFDGRRFTQTINAGADGLENLLSDTYVMGVPVEQVFEEYDNMDRQLRRGVSRLFRAGESVAGVRRILANALHREYADASACVVSDGDARELVSQEKRVPLALVPEGGAWRVEDLELPPPLARSRYGLAGAVAMRWAVRLGGVIPFYSKEGGNVSLQFSYMQWTYAFFQIDGVYGSYGFTAVDQMYDVTSEVRGRYVGLSPSIGLQLPVMLDAVLLLPYVRGFYGMHYALEAKQESFQFFRTYRATPGLGLGVNVAYKVGDATYLMGGIGGQYVVISSNFGGKETQGGGLELSFGVGF